MSDVSKLSVEELSPLLDALREGSDTTLPDALGKVISTAKGKGLSLEEFKDAVSFYGINRTEKFDNWLTEQY